MEIGDKVIVNQTKYNCSVCGVVVKITNKRIKVRTNFAPEENIKKHYGNKFPVAQYYKPTNVMKEGK
jgi:transcription initiation factor TFIIIB Brf1 subunit/transcription initiation factor TFIIB